MSETLNPAFSASFKAYIFFDRTKTSDQDDRALKRVRCTFMDGSPRGKAIFSLLTLRGAGANAGLSPSPAGTRDY